MGSPFASDHVCLNGVKVSREVGEGTEKIRIWSLGAGDWRLSIPDGASLGEDHGPYHRGEVWAFIPKAASSCPPQILWLDYP